MVQITDEGRIFKPNVLSPLTIKLLLTIENNDPNYYYLWCVLSLVPAGGKAHTRISVLA